MKLKLKMIAIAAAMVSMAGAANAAIVSDFTQDGTLVLQAFNTVTRNYYIRDLGFTLNSFLPSGVLASAGDPSSVLVGNKTPEGGLTLNAGTNANFGDATGWSAWIAGQNTANIRWNVSANDNDGVNRLITSSANLSQTAANGQVTNFTSSAYAGSVEGASANALFQDPGGIWFHNPTGAENNLDINWGLGENGLASLGGTAGLFYFQQTGPAGPAAGGAYGNSLNKAVVSLDAGGNFSYVLAEAQVAAVPLPAAAWLMGAGLMSLAGAARRRKAAQAV